MKLSLNLILVFSIFNEPRPIPGIIPKDITNLHVYPDGTIRCWNTRPWRKTRYWYASVIVQDGTGMMVHYCDDPSCTSCRLVVYGK